MHSLGTRRITWRNLSTEKIDMRFDTWNVRNLCKPGALKMVARELGKYKLYLVRGTEWAEDYTLLCGAGN
jgi:hypothetical protein